MKYLETARRLRDAMDLKHITAKELSERSGVNKSSISQYVNGLHKPSNIAAGKMAEVLGCNLLYLMGFDIDKTAPLTGKLDQLNDEGYQRLMEYADLLLNAGYRKDGNK